MAEKFVIQGGRKLAGEVEIRGSKNAAAAVLAATLLTKEECIIDNLPQVADILNLLDILREMGCEVERKGERQVKIRAGDNLDPNKIDFEKFSKARTSVLLIGPLLTRFSEFKISRPGGDRIGLRPITTHLEALKDLGVKVEEQGDFYYFKRAQGAQGTEFLAKEIVLSEFSVTATENLLMAVCVSQGKTIIKGAAQEPHVQDLCLLLNKMGGKIKSVSAHTLEIEGVKKLKGAEHTVITDYVEAGTFLVIGAACGGRVLVRGAEPSHLDLFLEKLKEMGVNFQVKSQAIEVVGNNEIEPVKVQALPYPGFPTDLLPLVAPLLTQAQGKSLIHDPLYENRLNYTQELRKMGADIEIVDPHRAFVFGKTPLRGVSIESWDIRAGASLIVAGLMAQGATTINSIGQIDRGYERIEERLQGLGAEIKRISNS